MASHDPSIANLAEQNVGPTIAQIRDYIISGVPTSPGEWVAQPTITITKNADATVNINVSAGTAEFPTGTVNYATKDYLNVALPSAGLQRRDAISGGSDGLYSYTTGETGSSTADPVIPAGNLLANFITLTNSGGTVTSPDSVPTFSHEGFDI